MVASPRASPVALIAVGTMISASRHRPDIASAGILESPSVSVPELVKDFLSGIFMIFEDQYGVGDVIDAGEASGALRPSGCAYTAARRQRHGLYVRNGEILRVGNMSQTCPRPLTSASPILVTGCAGSSRDRWELGRRYPVNPGRGGTVARRRDASVSDHPLEQWGGARDAGADQDLIDREGIEILFLQRVVWWRRGCLEPSEV